MLKRKGFTLIELLVVISIIALLMAILLPTLARAKEIAQAVVCTSNLKQMALVYSMYTEANNGYFPRDYQWWNHLRPFYENDKIRYCPTATKTWGQGGRTPFAAWGDGSMNAIGAVSGSYGYNEFTMSLFSGAMGDSLMWKTPNVKWAADIPMLGDIDRYAICAPYPADDPPAYEGQLSNHMAAICINRHRNGMVNWSFCDFSVRKVGLKELWKLKWCREWEKYKDEPTPVWPLWMRGFKEYE